MDYPQNGLIGPEPGVAPPVAPGDSPELLPSSTGSYPGKVLCSLVNAVFFEFVDEESRTTLLARAVPGKLYLNGRRNLLALLRTPGAVATFLQAGAPVRLRVARAEREEDLIFLRDEFGRRTVVPDGDGASRKRPDAIRRIVRTGTDKKSRTCSFVAVQIWSESWGRNVILSRPEEFLAAAKEAAAEEEEMLREVHCRVLKEEDELEAQETAPKEQRPWFLVSHLGAVPRSEPRWPEEEGKEEGVEDAMKGTVVELLRPDGGIVLAGSERVYFNRSRLLVDGSPVGCTDNLDDLVSVGDAVSVRTVPNVSADGRLPVVDASPTSKVAIWVHKGEEPEKLPAGKMDLTPSPDEPMLKVKVTELIQDSDHRAVAGVGVVCLVSMNALQTKQMAKMLGSYVYFEARDITCFGMSGQGVDLSFLRLRDDIHCYLQELTTEERARIGRNCHYRALKGTGFAKVDPKNIGAGGKILCPASISVHISLHRRGLHFEQLEKVFLRKDLFTWRQLQDDGLVAAAVTDFVDPGYGNPMSMAKVTLLFGEYKGKVLNLHRSNCMAFGHSMAKADLTPVLLPYETVFVDVSDLGIGSTSCAKAFLGRPGVRTAAPADMSEVERLDLLVWLQARELTMQEFKKLLTADKPERVFLPFPREVFQGRIVDISISVKPGAGCTGGVLIVDQGYEMAGEPNKVGKGMLSMKDQAVYLDRSNLWIFGHRMTQVDISYVMSRNQKLSFETVPVTQADRKRRPGVIPYGIRHRATIAWIGPTRPRGDRLRDPNRNDVGIKDWLLKRSLTMSVFENMVAEKNSRPNPSQNRDPQGFAMQANLSPVTVELGSLRQKGPLPSLLASAPLVCPQALPAPDHTFEGPPLAREDPVRPDLSELPVYRHGRWVAEMVESAILATGPKDSALTDLIVDDEMAQKAHHISQALEYALDAYRTKKGLGFGSFERKAANGAPAGPKPAKIIRTARDFGRASGGSDNGRGGGAHGGHGGGGSTWQVAGRLGHASATAMPFNRPLNAPDYARTGFTWTDSSRFFGSD